jgi:hypothetical protein
LILLAALALSSPASAADDLCSELRSFETAAAAPSDNPAERRWLEIHWAPARANWSEGCRHSKHEIGTMTCLMVMNHVRASDRYAVPRSIMACYSYRFAPGATLPWKGLIGNFVLKDQGGRRVTFELDYRNLPDSEGALRLAVEETGKVYQPAKLSRIKPFDAP